jgi:hypothetical protein
MKHLRKYNENKEELDCNYFNECFIEFIDDGAVTYSTQEKVKIKYPDIDVVLFHDNHPKVLVF